MTRRARGLEQDPDKHEGDQAQESDDDDLTQGVRSPESLPGEPPSPQAADPGSTDLDAVQLPILRCARDRGWMRDAQT